jgi:hypothetical protein
MIKARVLMWHVMADAVTLVPAVAEAFDLISPKELGSARTSQWRLFLNVGINAATHLN